MNVSIAGGSGFIGKNLEAFLKRQGYNVSRILRSDFKENIISSKLLKQDVIINLAGESITGRWTQRKKNTIYENRISTTRSIIETINGIDSSVKTIINISAAGIYDNINIHDERSLNYANNFLATVIRAWENELYNLKNNQIRIIILRMGVVLGRNEGLLKSLKIPLKLGVGIRMKINRGFPFILINDVLGFFDFVIRNENLSGIINVVAQQRIVMRIFFDELFKQKWFCLKYK
jgi:uncharacterized protein (TIGR01777 family)